MDAPFPLLPNADLRQLRNRAKDLVKAHKASAPEFAERLRQALPEWSDLSNAQVFQASFALKDAQRAIAREYGFESWATLARYIEVVQKGVSHDLVQQWSKVLNSRNLEAIRALVPKYPILLYQDFFPNDYIVGYFCAMYPPIDWAIKSKQADLVKLLVDLGLDLNRRSSTGTLPAMQAVVDLERDADGLKTEVLDYLLDHGADINLWCPNWGTPLEVATSRPDADPEVLTHLLDRGANVNKPLPYSGESVLIWLLAQANDASISDDQVIPGVQVLIDRGIDVNARAFSGLDDQPIEVGPYDAINVVQGGETALHRAATQGRAEVVELLLKAGADPNARTVSRRGPEGIRDNRIHYIAFPGETPLDYALRSGTREVIELLGGEESLDDLCLAVRLGAEEHVRTLLEAGADPNTVSTLSDETALAIAGRLGHRPIAKLLLHAGAAADQAFFVQAVSWADVTLVSWLVEKDSQIFLGLLDEPRVLMDLAAGKPEEHRRICQILHQSSEAPALILLVLTSLGRCEEAMQLAAAHPESIPIVVERMPASLHYFSRKDRVDMIELLLEWGVSADHRDHNHGTPIDHAIGGEAIDALKCLLNHDADPNIGYRHPVWTLFQPRGNPFLPRNHTKRNQMLEILVSHGARINHPHPNGQNALVYAYDLRKEMGEEVESSIQLLRRLGARLPRELAGQR